MRNALFASLLLAASMGLGCSPTKGTFASVDGGLADGDSPDGALPGDGGGGGDGAVVDGSVSGLAYPLTLTPLSKALTQTANISLFFSVSDAHGNGVPGLATAKGDGGAPSDFVYFEDGMAVDPTESAFSVTALSGNAITIPTYLVLQTSPSIIQNGELPTLKAAAKAIVAAMLPEQTMEIMTFADQVTPNVRTMLTSSQSQLNAAIDAINSADGTSTNLYGTLDYALTQTNWVDGFASMGSANGQLTAGILIVITNGSDNAARATLASVIQARGNKRVIAIGVGTSSTLDVGALQAIGNEETLITPSFQSLTTDITKVTNTIQSLGKSIYTASYCSPKRSGPQNNHQLSFTVVGNQSYNSATCTDATFTASQAATCGAGSTSSANTQACQYDYSTSTEACCPANLPYSCTNAPAGTCYATASEAAAACPSSCILCGGTGQGGMQDNQLVPGTQIVVPFNSSSYSSGQCPALWGPTCKSLQTCCANIPDMNYAQQCQSQLTNDLGNETQCQANLTTYCPSGTNCAALDTCCGGLPANSSAQQQCYSDLFQSAAGNELSCQQYDTQFCPSGPNCSALKTCCGGLPANSSAQQQCYSDLFQSAAGNESTCLQYDNQFCPTGPNCSALKTCCSGFPATSSISQSCFSYLYSYANGNELSCQQYDTQFCPTGANCTALKTCCEGFGGSGQDTCFNYFQSASGNELQCASYDTYTCPTGPNCSHLKTCCENFTGSQRDNCEYDLISNARGNESSCATYLTQLSCP